MDTITALQTQRQHHSRVANSILAEKGARNWTPGDQAKFNDAADQVLLLEQQIDAHRRLAEADEQAAFRDVQRLRPELAADPVRQALDVFVRVKAEKQTPAQQRMISNVMSTGSDVDGGYTVQREVAKRLIAPLQQYGAIRGVATNIVTDAGNDMSIPVTDGRSEVGELLGQNAFASSQDLTFASVGLNTYKFGSRIITVPIELLKDSSLDIWGMVEKRVVERIARAQSAMFSVGSGANQPTGIATAASVGSTGSPGQVISLSYARLVEVQNSLDVAYRPSEATAWFMNNTTLRVSINNMVDGNGRPLYRPGYGSGVQKRPDELLGYPLKINQDLSAPYAGAKTILFGQLDRYVIRDALEFTLFRFQDSPFVQSGQVGFLAWARAGGNLLDSAAVKAYQQSSS